VALRDRVDSALKRAGQAPAADRKYVPHITLGRLRGAPMSRVSEFLAANSLLRVGPIGVEHFTLFSSFLQGSGPIYHAEADTPSPSRRRSARTRRLLVRGDLSPALRLLNRCTAACLSRREREAAKR
jgi:2'-5' RNA ligase